MITAVDTSVLLDVFTGDASFGPKSRDALRAARSTGAVVACDVVWAEVAAAFPDDESATHALGVLGVAFVALESRDALRAGRAWRDYRRAGGGRDRMIADFLIGAHASAQADCLLTRDRGFYRRYFSDLRITGPSVR